MPVFSNVFFCVVIFVVGTIFFFNKHQAKKANDFFYFYFYRKRMKLLQTKRVFLILNFFFSAIFFFLLSSWHETSGYERMSILRVEFIQKIHEINEWNGNKLFLSTSLKDSNYLWVKFSKSAYNSKFKCQISNELK